MLSRPWCLTWVLCWPPWAVQGSSAWAVMRWRSETMKIVVDAMGGDHAPGVVVAGAVAEARAHGTQIILVGIESRVRAELARFPQAAGLPIEVVHASEVVEMDEHVAAVRAKRDSSMLVGMR